MSDRPAITVRLATADDMRLVKASWYESFRRGGFAPDVGSDIYHAGHARVIDDLVTRSKVFVAAVTELPDEICAWAAFEPRVLHYLYTKQAFRHLKIAQGLVQMTREKFEFCSHMTRGGKKLAQFLRLRYNPYLQHHPVTPALARKKE